MLTSAQYDMTLAYDGSVYDIDLIHKLILYTDIQIINSITSEYGFTALLLPLILRHTLHRFHHWCLRLYAIRNGRYPQCGFRFDGVFGHWLFSWFDPIFLYLCAFFQTIVFIPSVSTETRIQHDTFFSSCQNLTRIISTYIIYQFFLSIDSSIMNQILRLSFCFQMYRHTHTRARIHLKLPRIISRCKLLRKEIRKAVVTSVNGSSSKCITFRTCKQPDEHNIVLNRDVRHIYK